MPYNGTDRRLHRVYVTRNTEYHVRGDTCVAVRDRHTGEWLAVHLALRGQMFGGLKFTSTGSMTPSRGAANVGESLFFCASGRDVITSTVIGVERPKRDVVAQYAF